MTQAENLDIELKTGIFCLQCIDALSTEELPFEVEEKAASDIRCTLFSRIIQDLTDCANAYYTTVTDLNGICMHLLSALEERAEDADMNSESLCEE